MIINALIKAVACTISIYTVPKNTTSDQQQKKHIPFLWHTVLYINRAIEWKCDICVKHEYAWYPYATSLDITNIFACTVGINFSSGLMVSCVISCGFMWFHHTFNTNRVLYSCTPNLSIHNSHELKYFSDFCWLWKLSKVAEWRACMNNFVTICMVRMQAFGHQRV